MAMTASSALPWRPPSRHGWSIANYILAISTLLILVIGYAVGRQETTVTLVIVRLLLIVSPAVMIGGILRQALPVYRIGAVLHGAVHLWLAWVFTQAAFVLPFDIIRDFLFVIPMFLAYSALSFLLLALANLPTFRTGVSQTLEAQLAAAKLELTLKDEES